MNAEEIKEVKRLVENFKSKIFKKYNVVLYVQSKDLNKTNGLSLSELWDNVFVPYIKEEYPEYLPYISFDKKTKSREWVTINHVFAHIAYHDLVYSKSEIARFTNRNHATIINALIKSEEYMQLGDRLFLNKFKQIMEKYKEYVRTISEDTKVRNNA